jgi:integrase
VGAPRHRRWQAARLRVGQRRARQVEDGPRIRLRDAFDSFFSDYRPTLTNRKQAAQWRTTLETYAFPTLGDRDVAEIATRDIADALRPIWRTKAETAKRVQQRLRAVFDWAIASDHRTAANPAVSVKSILGDRQQVVRHQRALPYADVPAFARALRKRQGMASTRLSMEWLVLTATRSIETRGATWDEIDLDARQWTIPLSRNKMRKQHKAPHVVPLAPRCLEILDEARRAYPESVLIFPGSKPGKMLSENTHCKLLELMGLGEVAVAHGFRSAFRDWAGEAARADDKVAEACLAHVARDKVQAAYLRATFMEERRKLMEAWADYCGRATE